MGSRYGCDIWSGGNDYSAVAVRGDRFRGGTVHGVTELVVWVVKVAWIRACLKAGLSDHLDQQNASQKKKKKDQLWHLWLNAHMVLKDSMSMFL